MSFVGKWFGFGQDAQFDEGVRCFERGDFEGAAGLFRECLAGTGVRSVKERAKSYLAGSLGRLAAGSFVRRDFEDSLRYLSEAVEVRPGFADLWLSLARVKFVLGDSSGALGACEQALVINPGYANAKLLEGTVFYKSGMRDQGVTRMKEAVDADPRLLTAEWSEGLEAHLAGDFETALSSFKEIRPKTTDVHELMFEGDRLAKGGDWGGALERFDAAGELAPEYADLAVRRGQVLLETGDVEGAVSALQRATELNPDYAEAFALMGVGLRRLDREDEAMAAFRQALAIDPDQAIASQEVIWRRG